jgi:hypothetical protein
MALAEKDADYMKAREKVMDRLRYLKKEKEQYFKLGRMDNVEKIQMHIDMILHLMKMCDEA